MVKSSFTNYLMGIFGLSVTLISLYFYRQEISIRKMEQSKTPKVGTVVAIENDVRRKSSHRIFWQGIEKGASVHEGDFIRTGSHSSVDIALDSNNGGIHMDENGLAIISIRENEIFVNVVSGDLSVNGNLKVLAGNSRIVTEGAVFNIRRDAQGKIVLQSQNGTAIVSLGDGKQNVEVPEGSQLIMLANGQYKVKEFPLVRKLPADLSKIMEGTLIRFSFQKLNADLDLTDGMVLSLSRSENLSNPFVSKTINGLENDVSLVLEPGKYFWAVANARTKEFLTNVGYFDVVESSGLSWKSSDEILEWSETGLNLRLKWKMPETARTVTAKFFLGSTLSHSEELKSGELNWTNVRNELWKQLKIQDFRTEMVKIELSGKLGDDLTTPISKELKLMVRPFNFISSIKSLDKNLVQVSWDGRLHSSQKYQLKVADKLNELNQNYWLTATKTLLIALDKGVFVRTVSPEGQTDWVDLKVNSDMFLAEEPVKLMWPGSGSKILTKEKEIGFEWNYQLASKPPQYFELIVQHGTIEVVKRKIAADQRKVKIPNLPEGRYTWKVRGFWKDLGPGPFSSTRDFEVTGGGVQLRAPTGLKPKDKK